MECSLKIIMKFMVLLVVIVMSLMGCAFASQPEINSVGTNGEVVPVPACYMLCAFNKQCCPPVPKL